MYHRSYNCRIWYRCVQGRQEIEWEEDEVRMIMTDVSVAVMAIQREHNQSSDSKLERVGKY